MLSSMPMNINLHASSIMAIKRIKHLEPSINADPRTSWLYWATTAVARHPLKTLMKNSNNQRHIGGRKSRRTPVPPRKQCDSTRKAAPERRRWSELQTSKKLIKRHDFCCLQRQWQTRERQENDKEFSPLCQRRIPPTGEHLTTPGGLVFERGQSSTSLFVLLPPLLYLVKFNRRSRITTPFLAFSQINENNRSSDELRAEIKVVRFSARKTSITRDTLKQYGIMN
ncbi:hypothetical protein KIN20_036848 [Parelaphostrongylus tenuis]|uniref:Uncharacterized protein n=1 Tax=Parelaphostrongylus tenuis TaxID=148309 RepID=A0AAD5RD48_PARTN|nr:hypothetical protein KIN20_036848 [Parelaphostrongylus tenuis]